MDCQNCQELQKQIEDLKLTIRAIRDDHMGALERAHREGYRLGLIDGKKVVVEP